MSVCVFRSGVSFTLADLKPLLNGVISHETKEPIGAQPLTGFTAAAADGS